MASKWILLSEEERNLAIVGLAEVSSPKATKLISKLEKASKRITVASAKAKGAAFQVLICKWVSKLIGVPFLQGNDDSLILPRNSGGNGVDIILRGEARQKFPFSIECKAQENMNLVDTVNQSMVNQTEGTDWLVIHRRKALPCDLVILSLDTFEKVWNK